MDFSMGLVSAILTSVVFLPFFLIAYQGKHDTRKKYKIFHREALRLGLHLDEKEHWGNTFIGLDHSHSKLVYMRADPEELTTIEVTLDSVKNCEILMQQSRRKVGGKIELDLVKVDLLLFLSDLEERKIPLTFFDRDGQVSQDHEMERAERWKKKIQARCSEFKQLQSAS